MAAASEDEAATAHPESGDGDGSGSGALRDSSIKVFARVRPTKNDAQLYAADPVTGEVVFTVPRSLASGFINNQRERYEFRFNGLFDQAATQEDVFGAVGREAVTSVLEGYNATVFAYGQTGSGKTFTITGGPERYEDRGVIPRALSLLFAEIARRTNAQFTVYVSYLEIYNNSGYDLLDPDHDTKRLEDLRKVTMMADEGGNLHLRNLGMLPVASEEDALNLLFVGDTNRMICETPSNDASSRSHCIFTISLEARETGSTTIRRSKLHLVDLAGSERVKKTNVNGRLLSEAQAINLSLHYLEQVIVALHERAQGQRVHVPYRNSMMTSVLRDSLGGNCKTIMVATLSAEPEHIDESISTCRFAERVAMIRNSAVVNEEEDPQLVIARLKQEVRALKQEIAFLKGGAATAAAGASAPLADEERERCRRLVAEFLHADAAGPVPPGLSQPRLMDECWAQFRARWLEARASGGARRAESGGGGAAAAGVAGSEAEGGAADAGGYVSTEALQEEVRRLRLMVQVRDNEISMLVSMVKDRGDGAPQGGSSGIQAPARAPGSLPPSTATAGPGAPSAVGAAAPAALRAQLDPALLLDRNAAFEEFRKSYRRSQLIEQQKQGLRESYARAKALGEEVNAARGNINALKTRLERRRLELGAAALAAGEEVAAATGDAEEQRLLQEMESEKARYRGRFLELKALKSEIEHLQGTLEGAHRKLQADFENWWAKAHESAAATAVARPTETPRERPQSALRKSETDASMASSANASSGLTASTSRSSGLDAALPRSASSGFASPSAQPPRSTGNVKADREIAEFYRIRDELLRQNQPRAV
jgi:kinesin family protein 6/9